jgi:hypothetical protein
MLMLPRIDPAMRATKASMHLSNLVLRTGRQIDRICTETGHHQRPEMPCARPAEWITASTPASASDMLCGAARAPTTAPLACGGSMVGRRNRTRIF